MKLMYADRSVAMGDPRFVDMQLETLTSKDYARAQAARIDMTRALDPQPTPGIDAVDKERITNTLNSSCIDRFGNAVAFTQTIGNWWGSGLVVPGGGFCLNDEMADFSAKTGVLNSLGVAYGSSNAIRPGASPLSSMTPTVVFKDGEPVLVCGAAGGPRIIIEALQMILNVVEHGMRMDRAVASPLVCCLTKAQGLELEYGFSPDTLRLLEARGHTLQLCSSEEVLLCVPNGVERRDGEFYVCEPGRIDGVGGVLTRAGEKAYYGYRYK